MLNIEMNGKHRPARAHRLAWEFLNKRPIPKGLWGLHYCSNPPCCNGIHIYPGTPLDNARDAVKAGSFIGRYHGQPRIGEATPQSKLLERDIPVIDNLFMQGNTIKEIAGQFHVSPSVIHRALYRQTWKHIQPHIPHDTLKARVQQFRRRGEAHPAAKLTQEQVMLIRALFRQGVRKNELAQRFHKSWGYIDLIIRRKVWAHLP